MILTGRQQPSQNVAMADLGPCDSQDVENVERRKACIELFKLGVVDEKVI
jgi:hypothetical protein